MRILQINNFHYPRGGSDRYFLDLTALLREKGHDVQTFSSANDKNIHEDWLAVPPVDGIDTERRANVSSSLSFLYSRQARFAMELAIQTFKPDIAHLHIYYGQLTASILGPLRKANIPIVQTLHEYKTVCPTHGLLAQGQFCDACQGKHYWQAAKKRCNRNSFLRSTFSAVEAYISDALGAKNLIDQFVAVSDFQKSHLVRLGLPVKKVRVINHFSEEVSEAAEGNGEYFLYVGRITESKGIKTLLDAYCKLGRNSIPLRIVGTGPEERRWKAYADERGLSDKIEWCGFKVGEALSAEYRNCVVAINPSLMNETFGLTALECMAHARPVIASEIGALPEVVRDGKDGLLFPAGNSCILAERMLSFVETPSLTMKLGQIGRKRAINDFSKERHYSSLRKLYQEIRR